MHNIKVSHECPLCLLEKSLEFNQYDYALPHLLETNEQYRNFFLKSRDLGREIYLDNSLHELGSSMNDEVLIKWISILKPSNFFVPDVWEDGVLTLVNAKRWASIELPKETTKVAIIQATSLEEAMINYSILKNQGYEKIAFSYGNSYYNKISSHPNKDIGKALGRAQVIITLYKEGIIGDKDRIHLLGAACPFEFGLYKDFSFIESIDTSNPIMSTIDGISYKHGFHNKPKANLNNSFEIDKSQISMNLLMWNVNSFKKFLK